MPKQKNSQSRFGFSSPRAFKQWSRKCRSPCGSLANWFRVLVADRQSSCTGSKKLETLFFKTRKRAKQTHSEVLKKFKNMPCVVFGGEFKTGHGYEIRNWQKNQLPKPIIIQMMASSVPYPLGDLIFHHNIWLWKTSLGVRRQLPYSVTPSTRWLTMMRARPNSPTTTYVSEKLQKLEAPCMLDPLRRRFFGA